MEGRVRAWRAPPAAGLVAALVLGMALGGRAAEVGSAAGMQAARSGAGEVSTQGVITLLARDHPWVWRVPPDRLRVQEARADGGALRLVWVGVQQGQGGAPDGGPAHAFGLLARSEGDRDLFLDLTPFIDTGYPDFVLTSVNLGGGSGAFLLGAPGAAGRPRPILYVIGAPPRATRPDSALLLRAQGDVIVVGHDRAGRLQVHAGVYDFEPPPQPVLDIPPDPEGRPAARPARAVGLTAYTWNPSDRRFEVMARKPQLTPLGVAEAFLLATRSGDMPRALSLTSSEWRRVMGVHTPQELLAYLRASRPGLLQDASRYRLVGATVGQEAASILFTDAQGRIYRLRLRLGTSETQEMLVLPGTAGRELRGPWEVDGIDGGG